MSFVNKNVRIEPKKTLPSPIMARLTPADRERIASFRRGDDGRIFDPTTRTFLSPNHRLAQAFTEQEAAQAATAQAFQQRFAMDEANRAATATWRDAERQAEAQRRAFRDDQERQQTEATVAAAMDNYVNAIQQRREIIRDAESELPEETMKRPDLYEATMARILGADPQYRAVSLAIEQSERILNQSGIPINMAAFDRLQPQPQETGETIAEMFSGETPAAVPGETAPAAGPRVVGGRGSAFPSLPTEATGADQFMVFQNRDGQFVSEGRDGTRIAFPTEAEAIADSRRRWSGVPEVSEQEIAEENARRRSGVEVPTAGEAPRHGTRGRNPLLESFIDAEIRHQQRNDRFPRQLTDDDNPEVQAYLEEQNRRMQAGEEPLPPLVENNMPHRWVDRIFGRGRQDRQGAPFEQTSTPELEAPARSARVDRMFARGGRDRQRSPFEPQLTDADNPAIRANLLRARDALNAPMGGTQIPARTQRMFELPRTPTQEEIWNAGRR